MSTPQEAPTEYTVLNDPTLPEAQDGGISQVDVVDPLERTLAEDPDCPVCNPEPAEPDVAYKDWTERTIADYEAEIDRLRAALEEIRDEAEIAHHPNNDGSSWECIELMAAIATEALLPTERNTSDSGNAR